MKRHYFYVMILTLVLAKGYSQKRYTLQEALQTAKANNPDLKSDHFNIDLAESDEVTASLRSNPIFGFNYVTAAGSRFDAPNTAALNGANTQAYLQLGKVFPLPAIRNHKIAYASKNKALANIQYTEAERGLFLDIALKWVSVWGAKKKYDIVKKAKAGLDSIPTPRHSSKAAVAIDYSRITLLDNQYLLELKSTEQNLKNEALDLKYQLGVDDEVYIETNDEFGYPIPDNLKDFLLEASNNRSDILATKSFIAVADANVALQRALAYPQPELGMVYNPQNAVPYAGVYGLLEIPIFARNQGEIRKANSMKAQAQQHFEGAQVQLQKEVTNAYNSYQTLKANMLTYNKLLSQSDTILASIRKTYLLGETSVIDFLEAQRSSLETQWQYAEIMQQTRESYVRLLYVSGLINRLAE
jgi:cobalt-zinc-cadmium efflux system outer membrane protein